MNSRPEQPAKRHESRVVQRYRMDVQVSFVAAGADRERTQRGRTVDVCETGMGVYAASELVVGERLNVEFTPPYMRQPFKAVAVVRNRQGYRYGLHFSELTPECREQLVRLCRTLQLLQ